MCTLARLISAVSVIHVSELVQNSDDEMQSCDWTKARRWCGFAAATAMGTRGHLYKTKQTWSLPSLCSLPLAFDKQAGNRFRVYAVARDSQTCVESWEKIATQIDDFHDFDEWLASVDTVSCDLCKACSESVFLCIMEWKMATTWRLRQRRGQTAKCKAEKGMAFSKKREAQEAHSNIEKPSQYMRVTLWDKQLSTIIQTGHSEPDEIREWNDWRISDVRVVLVT